MPQSMTGIGHSKREDGPRSVGCEIRSVNHRHLEVRASLPTELSTFTQAIESQVRGRLNRGRIELTITLRHGSETALVPQVDIARARGYREAYSQLARALGVADEIPLTVIASAPGVLRPAEGGVDPERTAALLEDLVGSAISALEQMRDREGAALAGELEAHLGAVAAMVGRVRTEVPRAMSEKKKKLEERLVALLGDHRLDPVRLAQEVAMLIDRADVTEELERLESHCAQFTKVLSEPEPAGRKLDFLLQEMNREANTIGSKCADAAIAHVVGDLKLELERIREQVQNLE